MITRRIALVLVACGLALAGCDGCKKKKASGAGTGTGSASAAGSGSAAGPDSAVGPGSAAGPGSGSAPDLPLPPPVIADYLRVNAQSLGSQPGPVVVALPAWTITKASFDPANLEGGSAELEIDVGKLSTGITHRDDYVRSPDSLDVAKFPTLTIKVDNVKRAGDASYTADATVNAHGVEKKLPIKLEVSEQAADRVRISVTHTFDRRGFGIGGNGDASDGVGTELTLEALLTLTKP
jgi:polyisoprenoid-binding protein YceI